MKLLFYGFLLTFSMLSCTSEKSEGIDNSENKSGTKVTEDGLSKTYYPSGKLQISGKMNANGLKEGVWISYFENGQKNSESSFKNGINDGYSMVWYPNGNVRYFGDYKAGEQVGEWTYFDEQGKVVKTQLY